MVPFVLDKRHGLIDSTNEIRENRDVETETDIDYFNGITNQYYGCRFIMHGN